MKLHLKRGLILLLCAAMLATLLPVQATAAEQVDFNALLKAGQTDVNAIYVVTDPVFYTSDVSEFYGDYAAFRSLEHGRWGITNYKGKVVYEQGSEDDPYPIRPICENVFLGGSYSDMTYKSGYLYDFQGNRLLDEKVGIRNCGSLLNSATGKEDLYWVWDRSISYSLGPGGGYEIRFYGRIGSADGRIMEADRISFPVGGMVSYEQNGKWGLRKLFGEELLPQVYDFLMFVSSEVLLFQKDGKWGLMHADGSFHSEKLYDYAQPYLSTASFIILVKENGKYGLMTPDGSLPVPLCFDSLEYGGNVSDGSNDRYAFYGVQDGAGGYYYGDSESYWRMDDPIKNRVALDWPGMYLIPAGEESRIVDEQNRPLIEDFVSDMYVQTGNTLVFYMPEQNLTRFYDRNLKLLKELEAILTRTALGFCAVRTDENGFPTTEFYDEQGQLVRSLPGASLNYIAWGYPILRRETDGKVAIADGLGNMLTDYIYRGVDEISSGWDGLTYPYALARQYGSELYEIIDLRTRKNALFEGCFANDSAYLMPEGRYFPIFADGKTGFARLTARGESPFRDVADHAWYVGFVKFCCNAGLMSGTGNGKFSPKNLTTRAALVLMLYKVSGEKTASYGFQDVPAGKWYTDAVNWAAAKGIVNGKTAVSFAPNDPVTREQLVTILYKYAGTFAPQNSDHSVLASFADADKVSAYALDGMAWAVQNGLLSGKTADTIVPKGKATRAEIATIMMRFVAYMAGNTASP